MNSREGAAMALDQLDQSNWVVVAALAAPHLLYAFIWFFPQRWMENFKKSSVQVFESVAWLLKALQFSSLFYWYVLRRPSVDLAAIPLLAWLVAAPLGVGGQALNAGIFRAIGRPVPALHQGVWDVVCLAALNAMDSARVLMWERQRQNQGQPGEELADAAGRQAVARFWALLADFCGLGMAPRRWREQVPAGHPFLHWVAAEKKWRVHRR